MDRKLGLGMVLALLWCGVGPRDAAAQVSVTAYGGAAGYDLSGTGTSAVLGARVGLPLGAGLEAEVAAGYFWYESQARRDLGMLLPEVGIRWTASQRVPFYLGVGAGHTLGVKGEQEDDPTLFAALGIDLPLAPGWAIRPEMRVRAVDPWVGTIGDFTLGVRYRFQP